MALKRSIDDEARWPRRPSPRSPESYIRWYRSMRQKRPFRYHVVAELGNSHIENTGQYQYYDQEDDPEDLPGESSLFSIQDEQVRREDADVKQQAHRRREQHQVEDVGSGRHDRGNHKNAKDRV